MLLPGLLAWWALPRAPVLSHGMDMHRKNVYIPEPDGLCDGTHRYSNVCITSDIRVRDVRRRKFTGFLDDDNLVLRWRTKLIMHAFPLTSCRCGICGGGRSRYYAPSFVLMP